MILAGDIGGTKTHLAIFSAEQGAHDPIVEAIFPSALYRSLDAMASEFLERVGTSIDAACFGVAGPVVGNRARITNLPWIIDAEHLGETLRVERVRLINDLEAVANAVPVLQATDLYTLNAGKPVDYGAIGIIAPGTGLGEAFLVWDGNQYQAYPSEGGHATFGPNSLIEVDMLRYLMERFGHVSYERVCSGMGIPNIYSYFRDSQYAEELPDVLDQLGSVEDKTPVIVNAAIRADDPSALCRRTLDMFVSVLGVEAGNLALNVLATGGVYLGGGIPPRILQVLESDQFMQAFRHKGRFSEQLLNTPVSVIMNPKTALIGAARVGLRD
ncbi:MAG: glucokinase [Chloroflexaceae bacterium]|nr:glucokinase [Chloroflexaceae bacterium]